MKNTLALLVTLCALTGAGIAFGQDPLERKVASISFDSFNEAVGKLEKATGFQVSCPKDTAELMQKIWKKGRFMSSTLAPEETVKRLVDGVVFNFGLNYKLNPEEHTIALDLPWRVVDPRPARELLQAVMKEGDPPRQGKDPQWCAAFHALLCKDGNFARAAALRQTQVLESFWRIGRNEPGASATPAMDLLMKAPIISVSGEKFLGVFFCEPIHFYPGNGSISYYWFKEDGTLAGVGMMNTGHRSEVFDASVHDRFRNGKPEATEVHLILKFNVQNPYIARFVLEESGLRLIHLFDTFGDSKSNDGLHVGESLLPAEK